MDRLGVSRGREIGGGQDRGEQRWGDWGLEIKGGQIRDEAKRVGE